MKKMLRRLREDSRIRLGLSVLVLIVVGLVIAYLVTPLHTRYPISFPHAAHSTFERDADQIIATCKSAPYPPACYDKEIPKLMDQGLSMEDSFAVTSIIQDKTKSYYFCHVLGHELASKETAKDPSKWTEVIARCPVG